MKPIRSESFSVASSVTGTPETKENPNRSSKSVVRTETVHAWKTYDVRKPFEESTFVF
jgi:hypothetical protein